MELFIISDGSKVSRSSRSSWSTSICPPSSCISILPRVIDDPLTLKDAAKLREDDRRCHDGANYSNILSVPGFGEIVACAVADESKAPKYHRVVEIGNVPKRVGSSNVCSAIT